MDLLKSFVAQFDPATASEAKILRLLHRQRDVLKDISFRLLRQIGPGSTIFSQVLAAYEAGCDEQTLAEFQLAVDERVELSPEEKVILLVERSIGELIQAIAEFNRTGSTQRGRDFLASKYRLRPVRTLLSMASYAQ